MLDSFRIFINDIKVKTITKLVDKLEESNTVLYMDYSTQLGIMNLVQVYIGPSLFCLDWIGFWCPAYKHAGPSAVLMVVWRTLEDDSLTHINLQNCLKIVCVQAYVVATVYIYCVSKKPVCYG